MFARILRPLSALAMLFVSTLLPSASLAEEQKPVAKAANVPLKRVVMFNSGVGYFQRQGEVEGDASIDLMFKADLINDLLKSMTLEDLGGGKIAAVNYGSRDPITKTLQTFSINLTGNPTLGQLLDQARGEQVELEAAEKISGALLGVERRKREVGKDRETVETEYLNLLTDAGLRSVPLESVSRIRFADPKLDNELRQALKVLAMSHDNDKKTVSLNFQGQGKRPVRVGYIQQTPVWKTSYRLVLTDGKAPYLQGWAIVENTTEEDWDKVQLNLVGGRPISFAMDLYQPLYVQRPLVEPELFASLRPNVYGDDLGDIKKDELGRERSSEARKSAERYLRGAAGKPAAPGDSPAESGADFYAGAKVTGLGFRYDADGLNLARNGGAALAQGEDVGEMFQYAISTPVTLPRQQSAMLPIVGAEVKGDKVSIYNEGVQAKHPLSGLRLKNVTDLHLTQGPITVFEEDSYAGDARIEDLQPGADRLVSYAIDLDIEVAPKITMQPQQFVGAKLLKGTLSTRTKLARSKKYAIKNSGKKAKNLLVEYPIESGWVLVEPKKPSETTRDRYRFATTVEAGKSSELAVEEELIQHQNVEVTNVNDETVAFYVRQPNLAPAVKAALEEMVRRKQQLSSVAQKRQSLEGQVGVIGQEQDRIRKNMQQLDRNSDLYRRYVTKFTEQEEKIEKLRGEIEQTLAEEGSLKKNLDEYLLGLDVG